MAPPPRMNQTWFPSQVAPTLLMIMRRSSSVRPAKGSKAADPRSKPSVRAKPISSTPSSSHQMTRSVS